MGAFDGLTAAFTGQKGNYNWLEIVGSDFGYIKDLLELAPQIVRGKYVSITSFDSGPLKLSAEEINEGWYKHGEIAISPCISVSEQIPNEQYDEWYIFASATPFDDYKVFVNYGGFSLQAPEHYALQADFWKQLERIGPESYFAEGDHMIWVTCNGHLFGQACQALAGREVVIKIKDQK